MTANPDPTQPPAKPNDAATLILVRETEPQGFEVFLMRRHRNQSFMGGAFVFPGGRVDPMDRDPGYEACCRGFDADRLRARFGRPEAGEPDVRGWLLAAVRETFEESGLLFAEGPGESPSPRLGDYRRRVHQDAAALKDMAHQEGLRFTLGALAPFAHWITPEAEKKRFDTRFFIAQAPAGQTATHDDVEMVESVWLRPARALDRHAAGELPLMPPTFKSLEELAAFDSLDSAFRWVEEKEIFTIQPQLVMEPGYIALVLPHDPEYGHEAYRRPLCDEPSRIVLRDGHWVCEFAE